jgi:hypothetical protein
MLRNRHVRQLGIGEVRWQAMATESSSLEDIWQDPESPVRHSDTVSRLGRQEFR